MSRNAVTRGRVTRYRDKTGRKRWQPTLPDGRKLWWRSWDSHQIWSHTAPDGHPILCRSKAWAKFRSRYRMWWELRQFERG